MVKWGGPPGPPVVTVQRPHSVPRLWLGTLPGQGGGERQAPGVKGSEDMQARMGMGEFRAAEPFFTEAWFPAGPLWKRHRT